jgi:hypothetical protein
MSWDTVKHDDWENDEVEKEEDLPDPKELFVPAEEGDDVAP